jgi:hypothetical protein
MPNSLKSRLRKLPITKKLILFGSFLALISVFMPWYKDIDKFNTGDMFLGITGPLYLAGIIVLLSSGISFGVISLRLFEKPLPKLPLKEDHLHIFTGSLSTFMLIMAISVYFHNKFGISLVDKTMGIGMMFGFVGAGLSILGAVLSNKKAEIDFETDGELKPLINLEDDYRHRQDLSRGRDYNSVDSEKVKVAVSESIDEFTDNFNYDSSQHTKDIR